MAATSRNKTIFVGLLFFLLLVGAVAAIVPAIRGPMLGWFHGEAFFNGQPVSVWSERLAQETNAQGDTAAFEQLKNGGKSAVPVLMAIAFGDSGPRSQALVLLISHGEAAVPHLMKVLNKATNEDRRQAAVILGAIGPKAKPAVEALARLLDDDDELVREAGMAALEQIGPQAGEAVPELIAILEGKGKSSAGSWLLQATRVLGKIGPPAQSAVRALTACLNDRHIWFVREACIVLGGLGKDAAPAVPALIDVLKNREPARDTAAFALGKIGPDAKPAVPVLIETLLNTNRPELRDACKLALANMGGDARPAVLALLTVYGKAAPIIDIGPAAVPELVQLLATPEKVRQPTVLYFLEAFRKQARPALVKALQKDKNPQLRLAVAAVLGPAWGDANLLVPALLRALADADRNVRQAARQSIVAFGKEARPFLEQELRGKKDAVRLEAVQLLGRLGGEAKSSARVLLLVLKEENPALHVSAVYALGNMGFHPKEAVPALIEALKARKQLDETLVFLAAHGRGAKDAIPLVCGLLQDADWKIRRQAVFALERIGVDKDTILPVLTKMLQDKDDRVRAAVAHALGSARLLKDDVVPMLMKLLEDSSDEMQGHAMMGLGQFGSAGRAAVPLIRKIAGTSKNPHLCGPCVRALGGIGPVAQEAAPMLLSWLVTSKSDGMRILVVEALGKLQAKEAVAAIEPLMQTSRGDLGAAAALALWRIQQSPAALAFLHDGLKDKNTRSACIRALGGVGPAASKTVPALIDILLREPDLGQRAFAAEALSKMNAVNARPALKALVAALRLPHAGLRTQAALTLARFDEDARDASARLVELLNDPESPDVRAAAADALLRIDPEAAANAGVL